MNPEVTVRGRGVMEKCTYCIQRIEAARITTRKEGGRPFRDGDVVTACQAACPTRAIDFGNIVDETSIVYKKREQDPRSYGLLSQLNVKPRTEYLARIRNPHSRLMTAKQKEDLVRFKDSVHGHGDHDQHPSSESHPAESHPAESHPAESHPAEPPATEAVQAS
jgi:molybdopterin-containing oxidoreductase family iron-sulfur binding subunit